VAAKITEEHEATIRACDAVLVYLGSDGAQH
jgi:hypothetical protein